MWIRFCRKGQLPHTFGLLVQDCVAAVPFPHKFHTRKLGEITVFHTLRFSIFHKRFGIYFKRLADHRMTISFARIMILIYFTVSDRCHQIFWFFWERQRKLTGTLQHWLARKQLRGFDFSITYVAFAQIDKIVAEFNGKATEVTNNNLSIKMVTSELWGKKQLYLVIDFCLSNPDFLVYNLLLGFPNVKLGLKSCNGRHFSLKILF